jgi:predicted ATPase
MPPMRLISARVRGYGRLVDTGRINLDAKVIAIVGPNEAGKSTLLRALTECEQSAPVPREVRSRAEVIDDNTRVTEVEFILDQGDVDAVSDLDLQERPQRITFLRLASGTRQSAVTPHPAKSPQPLVSALRVLDQAASATEPPGLIESVYTDPDGDAPRDFRTELDLVRSGLGELIADPTAAAGVELAPTAESLASVLEADEDALRDALTAIAEWLRREDPAAEVRLRLWKRSPDFIFFDEADRELRSSYTFSADLAVNPPNALRNLAGTAGLDLAALHESYADLARRRTAIARANQRLDEVFHDAWKQSRLSVHFNDDGDQLQVELIESGETVTVFDERSAGLRVFVALIAFLKWHRTSRPPILLIDEAENHLHLDAQADLVGMFVIQEGAAKVIYTTHSPACLPPDLGTGIRAVVPRADNHQVSDVRNSFWQNGPGYSPLMVAMGAAAAAFTTARNVVLSEGATEMILLPTLLRLATGQVELPYQIAPGLSEAPVRLLPALDLEAARVAYLVDEDAAGVNIERALREAGVAEAMIFRLGVPGIENLLKAESYRDAVAALIAECNYGAELPALPETWGAIDTPWASAMETWAANNGLRPPSKVAISSWLVQNGRAALSPDGELLLKRLHGRFVGPGGPFSGDRSR